MFNKNLPPLTIQRDEGSCAGFVRLRPDFIIIKKFKESRGGVALRHGLEFNLVVQALVFAILKLVGDAFQTVPTDSGPFLPSKISEEN
ncbi:hypothetical protein IH970_11740 [candidate division KSB1 bacterium]|nr:hypothetical protein [candidate division KSB1 bacterium]